MRVMADPKKTLATTADPTHDTALPRLLSIKENPVANNIGDHRLPLRISHKPSKDCCHLEAAPTNYTPAFNSSFQRVDARLSISLDIDVDADLSVDQAHAVTIWRRPFEPSLIDTASVRQINAKTWHGAACASTVPVRRRAQRGKYRYRPGQKPHPI